MVPLSIMLTAPLVVTELPVIRLFWSVPLFMKTTPYRAVFPRMMQLWAYPPLLKASAVPCLLPRCATMRQFVARPVLSIRTPA